MNIDGIFPKFSSIKNFVCIIKIRKNVSDYLKSKISQSLCMNLLYSITFLEKIMNQCNLKSGYNLLTKMKTYCI